jgi:hypothetical protein
MRGHSVPPPIKKETWVAGKQEGGAGRQSVVPAARLGTVVGYWPDRRPGLLANQNWIKMVGRPAAAAAAGGGGGLILGDRQAQGACWEKDLFRRASS